VEIFVALRRAPALLPGEERAMMPAGQTRREWRVAEIQGLYGPFIFTERLLQKIWLRGEFDSSRATAEDGRPVRVLRAGRWNLLGGPDFRHARLRLGGEDLTGDVELHLHAGDWAAHAHASDPAYDQVVLHVVLFPPAPGEQARRADGRPIATLILLPLLLHDLEEYAAEDAIETLTNRADWRAAEELAALPAAEARAVLRVQAEGRWRQKVHFARRRLARLGWTEACHQTALEILGYRFNRAPMLKVAVRMPLAAWSGGPVDVDALIATEAVCWNLQGVRPANHPRVRLRQYAAWTSAQPAWTERLARLADDFPAVPVEAKAAPTVAWRKQAELPRLRALVARDITGDAVQGTRLDNLICDGFLPLWCAHTGRNYSGVWFHWYAGDLPPRLKTALRSLGVFDRRTQPACHGFAQGLLGWMLARESAPIGAGESAAVAAVGG
jgi:Protein of unknown function (DUF2851)